MDHYKLYIDGEFIEAQSGKVFETIDPGTEQPIATVAQAGKPEAEAAVDAARRAFDRGDWSGMDLAERLAKVRNFADQIANRSGRMTVTESLDAGMVIEYAKLVVPWSSSVLRNLSFCAATEFPWEEEIPASGNAFSPGRDFIRREPIGVCVGIVPWNFPSTLAIWKIAPALIMGNSIVIKPAINTPLTALILAEAGHAAGIPKGVLNVIPGSGGELGRTLCCHPDVDKVAFTGSTVVGREIMKMASDTVKKVTLELGGKSANIILDDADIPLAVEGAVYGAFLHQGQICESGTRVLVSSKIYDAFIQKMKERTESLRVGYQLDPNAHLGPLVSKEQLDTVDGYVKLGIEEGAELITGGKRIEVEGITGGFYYAPTILANVNNKTRVAQEEIFGPVVCIIPFDSDEEAVAIANDSPYGLAGAVFSTRMTRAERIARRIRTGTMWINNYHVLAENCPFGGYKQSGTGRELGEAGLAEYTQIKRIHASAIADRNTNFYFNILKDDKTVEGFGFHGPTHVVAGHGSIVSIYKAAVDQGCTKAMILTDPGVAKAGLADLVKDSLVDLYAGMYREIPSDPDIEVVDEAVAKARELGADGIITVGGGSVIDVGKMVCIALKNGGKADAYLNRWMMLSERQIPHIAVPTTAGTGSEVTSAAVITSKNANRKLFVADRWITPDVAVLDPRFTVTLPMAMTVSTAMDALTHAIEALTSTLDNPISDGHALNAIRIIHHNLPIVVANGRDKKARLNLQVAATAAGWAFSSAQVGLAHAVAHSLGTLHKLPHGTACGIVIPKVMRYNLDNATEKLALIAQQLGVKTAGIDQRDAALAAAEAVEALMKRVGHPLRLSEVGIPEESLPNCALHAIGDTALLFNARRVVGLDDVLALLQQAY